MRVETDFEWRRRSKSRNVRPVVAMQLCCVALISHRISAAAELGVRPGFGSHRSLLVFFAEERPAPLGGPGTLRVTDERTGKQYTLQLNEHGHLKAADLKQIKAGGDGVGLRTYDPG